MYNYLFLNTFIINIYRGVDIVHKILEFNSVKDFLSKIDDNAYDLLNKWKDYPNITNDEKIADMFNVKVTIVRSILNKLSYRGIVIYDKVKDKNSGWYNYYWRINFEKLAKIIYTEHKDIREKINKKLDIGNTYNLFACKNECSVIPFEIAAEYTFQCPHCPEKLNNYDYSKKMQDMESYLTSIESEMKYIKNVLITQNNEK